MAQQLTFDLGHRAAQGRDDFLIAPSNQDAVAWIDRWPDWPAPALVLHGPAACGKSHLAAVWAEQSGAVFVAPSDLAACPADEVFARGPHLAVDGVDSWIGDRASETTLFHLYNMAREQGRTMLLTLRTAPVRLDFAIPDLASRLRAAPAVAIHAPDETLLGAVLVKMFSDRQVQVGHDVLAYILPRMERSFVAARDFVDRIDAQALAQKRAISVPLARDVLTQMQDISG